MSKIIKAVFTGRFCKTQRVFQFDTDDKLQIVNVDLPANYTVDFSNSKTGDSVSVLATSDTVQIPPDLFVPGSEIYAWIWLSDGNGGHTRCEATIPIDPRARRTGTEPTPAQASAWDEAVDTLNETIEGIPTVINSALTEAKESGEFDGKPGAPGPAGAPGAAGNGIWWTVSRITSTGVPGYGEIRASYLKGRSGAPAAHDLVVGPLIGETNSIANLYEISSVVGRNCALRGIGTIKGVNGDPGLGFPAGGQALHVLRKKTDADYDTEWANPMDLLSDEVKRALLQLAQKVAYIDYQGQTYYQDLYDALYPPAVLASIRATFAQGSTVIYNTDSLDVLKPLLTVTAVYDDGSTETVPAADYTLSGALETGTSTITVSYQGKTDTFQVTVTAAPMAFPVTNNLTGCTTSNSAAATMENEPYSAVITPASGYTLAGASVVITMAGSNITASAYSGGVISIPAVTGALVISVAAVEIVLSSITAAYTQSGTVYDTDTLDSLKADLVVTAHYSDGSTATVAAEDYTLSGTLTEGTSTITVNYGGETTTFSVTVTQYVVQTNYVEVGTPTIENGILTVTDGNFIKTAEAFSPGSAPWKIRVKYKHNSVPGSTAYQDIFGGVDASNASVRTLLIESSYYGSRPIAFLSSNNSSWDISSTLGAGSYGISNYTVTNWLWLELSYDGSKYYFQYSFDGETFTGWELSSTAHVYDGFAVAYGLKRNGILNGQIDLSECKIWINEQLWWEAIS